MPPKAGAVRRRFPGDSRDWFAMVGDSIAQGAFRAGGDQPAVGRAVLLRVGNCRHSCADGNRVVGRALLRVFGLFGAHAPRTRLVRGNADRGVFTWVAARWSGRTAGRAMDRRARPPPPDDSRLGTRCAAGSFMVAGAWA